MPPHVSSWSAVLSRGRCLVPFWSPLGGGPPPTILIAGSLFGSPCVSKCYVELWVGAWGLEKILCVSTRLQVVSRAGKEVMNDSQKWSRERSVSVVGGVRPPWLQIFTLRHLSGKTFLRLPKSFLRLTALLSWTSQRLQDFSATSCAAGIYK